MRDAWTIAGCMIRRLWHGWLLALLVIGLVAQAAVLVQVSAPSQEALLVTCRNFGFGVTFFSTALLVIVAAGTELPREIHSGTIFFVLTKPVRRMDLLLGKLFGLLVLGSASVFFQTILATLILACRGLYPDMGMLLTTLVLTMRIWVIAATALFFSSFLSELPTLMFSALYIALGYIMGLMDYFIRFAISDIPLALTLRLIYFLIPNMTYLGSPAGLVKFLMSMTYGLLYVVLLWCLSCWVFTQREFRGRQ